MSTFPVTERQDAEAWFAKVEREIAALRSDLAAVMDRVDSLAASLSSVSRQASRADMATRVIG